MVGRWLIIGITMVSLLLGGCGGDQQPDPIAGDYYYAQGALDLSALPSANGGCPEDVAALTQQLWDVNKASPNARQLLERAYSVARMPACAEDVLKIGLDEAIIYVEASSRF